MVVELNIFSMIIGAILGELVRSYMERKIQECKDKNVKKMAAKDNKTTNNDSKTEES